MNWACRHGLTTASCEWLAPSRIWTARRIFVRDTSSKQSATGVSIVSSGPDRSPRTSFQHASILEGNEADGESFGLFRSRAGSDANSLLFELTVLQAAL